MFCFDKNMIIVDNDYKIIAINELSNSFILEDSNGNIYTCDISVIDYTSIGERLLGDCKELKK